jgi:hypothetical protein
MIAPLVECVELRRQLLVTGVLLDRRAAQRRHHERRHDRHPRHPEQHHDHADDAAGRRLRDDVAVPDGRDGHHRPPQGEPDRREHGRLDDPLQDRGDHDQRDDAGDDQPQRRPDLADDVHDPA